MQQVSHSQSMFLVEICTILCTMCIETVHVRIVENIHSFSIFDSVLRKKITIHIFVVTFLCAPCVYLPVVRHAKMAAGAESMRFSMEVMVRGYHAYKNV